MRVLGAKRWDVLVKVGLPRSMPFFDSLKIAITLAFAGLVVIGAMVMAMYELFSFVEKHTAGWAHRGSHGEWALNQVTVSFKQDKTSNKRAPSCCGASSRTFSPYGPAGDD